MKIIRNSLEQSHDIIRSVVREGDIVVDATAGNGYDTVFLANLVGKEGKVFSFDIQEEAIIRTKQNLEKNKLCDRVVLINDSHASLDKYIDTTIKAAMFNLGYLPGGDHTISTKPDSTIAAL